MCLLNFLLLCPNFLFKRVMLLTLSLSLTLSFSAWKSVGFKDLFPVYAEQLKEARSAQAIGDFKTAAALFTEPKKAQNNYTLNLLEKTRWHFLEDNCVQSRKHFALVSQILDEDAPKAKLRLNRGASNVASLVSSDNVITYQISAY